MSFEEAMKELDQLTRKLEEGNMPLDESIKAFEKGHQLKEYCEAILRNAQLKVEKIINNQDGVNVNKVPFDDSDI